jgi:hypothetical protein
VRRDATLKMLSITESAAKSRPNARGGSKVETRAGARFDLLARSGGGGDRLLRLRCCFGARGHKIWSCRLQRGDGIVGDTLNRIAHAIDHSEIDWVHMRHEEAGAFVATRGG